MSERRDAVRENALYLRNVRPIDPEELREYVPGSPHPGVVRSDLRDLAPELELVERPDGTFVPVCEEPAAAPTLPIKRLPAPYEERLVEELAAGFGPEWEHGDTGDRLRLTIRDLKERYHRGHPVDYDDVTAAGYAIYHLPAYYAAIQYVLAELTDRQLLPRSLRVLDVGAGVGGPALGLVDALPADALVEYHAVEPGAGVRYAEALLEETGRNVHSSIHRERIEAVDLEGQFDLVCCCNVLSELSDPEAVLERCLEWLEPDGTLLAMAPADEHTATNLRSLERQVEDRSVAGGTVTVYGPSPRFWSGERPTDRGWSFDVRPDLAVPSFQRRLDGAATGTAHDPGEFVNVDVQFAYSLLRLDGTRRYPLRLDEGRWARMADMERHVTNRIDLVAAKLSRGLHEDPDANPLYKVSDGSEDHDHYAVCTLETATNRALHEADYGEPLVFERTLALWNEDESAYNLVVDDETIVERAG